jgi:AraC-like DNA-binding protein
MGYSRSMPADGCDSIRYHRLPLAGVDAMRANTSRAFPRHTHDQYGIGLVDAGGHSSWSGRGQVEAGPGTFISVNPGEVHDGHAVGGVARAWRIVYLEPVALAALRIDVLEGAGGEFEFGAPVFADGSLRAAFEAAYECAALPESGDAQRACEIALLQLIARLGSHGRRRERLPATSPDVRRVRERIDADPAANHGLVELAGEGGVSRFQLIRGFQRALGLSPHAYIVQQRLALARRLIRRGDALADVALTAGFCDQSHLARCFTRQFGVPPRRYALLS